MNKFKIILPWPDRDLSPNARLHWAPEAKAAAQALHDGYWSTKEQAPFGIIDWTTWKTILAQYTFNPPDRRRRDQDNYAAMMKSYQDGVCQALGIDDYIFVMDKPIWLHPIKYGQVILTLEELPLK